MKRRGFTLVELLAVIVILAIIALIATPIILNVIKDARRSAALESFKGYIDGVEKALTINQLKENEDFPTPDTKGCYELISEKGIDQYVEIKGTRPTFKSGATVCVSKGTVVSVGVVSIDGFDFEYKNNKYSINGEVVEEKGIVGIPSKDYTIGETVNYLGYTWKVMKDNGNNTQLVMNGYLSSDELKANLPSDIDNSEVTSNGMSLCYANFDTQGSINGYCNAWSGSNSSYSWNNSLIKPTIEKWLENKMKEKGLTKDQELIGMAFTDGIENITSYVRIPLYDEIKSMNGPSSDINAPYSPDETHYMYDSYSYWTLTSSGQFMSYAYLSSVGVYWSYTRFNNHIRPVITVKEK